MGFSVELEGRSRVRDIVRRAFEPPAPGVEAVLVGALPEPAPQRLVVMVPTAGSRSDLAALRRTLDSIGVSLAHAKREHPGCRPVFLLLAQWLPPQRQEDCVAAIEATAAWWMERFDTPVLGLAITPRSKILALNAAAPLLDRLGAGAVAWFDDDILVTEGCIGAMLSAWTPEFDGVVGGAKETMADRSRFSAWWARRKNQVEPVNLYPHGCSILMGRRVFGTGIPPHFQSDDSYLLLRHLDPGAALPFNRLRVVPHAVVKVPAPNRSGAAARRIARNYRNALRIAAEAPPETARFFLWQILFVGLAPPSSQREFCDPRYWGMLFWYSLKFLFWLGLAAEIILRGLLNFPRKPVWYEAPYPEVFDEPRHDRH